MNALNESFRNEHKERREVEIAIFNKLDDIGRAQETNRNNLDARVTEVTEVMNNKVSELSKIVFKGVGGVAAAGLFIVLINFLLGLLKK